MLLYPSNKPGRGVRAAFGIVMIGVLVLVGCRTISERSQAERIFTGGNIVTANPQRPEVEALATRNGRILALGDREEVLAHRSANTELMELGGRALLPGFIDPHTQQPHSASPTKIGRHGGKPITAKPR